MARDTPHRTQTEIAQDRGPTGNTQHDDAAAASSIAATVAVVTGALGVIVGIIPKLGVGALILAAIALVAGVPATRSGRRAPTFSRARTGVVLAVIAVVLGILNIAIQLDVFDYFTTS